MKKILISGIVGAILGLATIIFSFISWSTDIKNVVGGYKITDKNIFGEWLEVTYTDIYYNTSYINNKDIPPVSFWIGLSILLLCLLVMIFSIIKMNKSNEMSQSQILCKREIVQ